MFKAVLLLAQLCEMVSGLPASPCRASRAVDRTGGLNDKGGHLIC